MKTRLFLILGALVGCAGSVVACGEEAPPPSTVAIELDEYTVSATSYKATAGHVTFTVRNVGVLEHELMVLRTDVAVDGFPISDGEADLERVGHVAGWMMPDMHGDDADADAMGGEMGEMHEGAEGMEAEGMAHEGHLIEPNGTGQGVFNLEPGSYVLLCNLPTHYRLGMFAEIEIS